MIFLENVVKYEIEYNPVSKTWCLYRYNIQYQQRVLVPIYQDAMKENVEKKLKEIQKRRKKK